MTDKIAAIIEKLRTRTHARQAVWANTSRESEYQLKLPSGRITVDHWITSDGQDVADFRIYNSEGAQIALEVGRAGTEDFKRIVSLHDTITMRKLNIEETLSGIEKELDAKGDIGDEIPF
jgi:hypothetical protein